MFTKYEGDTVSLKSPLGGDAPVVFSSGSAISGIIKKWGKFVLTGWPWFENNGIYYGIVPQGADFPNLVQDLQNLGVTVRVSLVRDLVDRRKIESWNNISGKYYKALSR